MENKSIVITRGQIGQIASFLAGFGGLLGFLGLIWQGSMTPYIVFFFVLAMVSLVVWAVITPQDFRGFFTGRQIQRSTVAIFSTLLLIGIVSVSYIIVKRAVIVGDITIDNRFTLDDRTLEIMQVVKRSPRPIRIIGFYEAQDLIQREIDDQYWQLYEVASEGMITRQYISAVQEPGLAEPFQFAISQGYHVFLGFVNPDGTTDLTSVTPVNNQQTQEQDMTEAIARLLTAGNFKVYFEQGLGTLDGVQSTSQSMSNLNNALRATGLITDALDLEELGKNNGSIPKDASAVILARPDRDLTLDEIAVLDRYLKTGGTLFIAADFSPRADTFMAEGSPFNNYLWIHYGLRMFNAVVVDTDSKGPTELDVVSSKVFAENAIGAHLNIENKPETAAIFHLIRAIDVSETPPVTNGRVVMSSDLSWGETDTQAIIERNEFVADTATDIRGPLTLVAFAYSDTDKSKIVLVGDADFLTNGYTDPQTQSHSTGNANLFLDSIGWLTGFTQQVEFSPGGYTTTPVLFSGGDQLDIIGFITVIVMPGSMLAMAGLIYVRRYRK